MKINAFLIGAFFGMFILSSCNDDETPVVRDDSLFWGYFKAEINEDKISLENNYDNMVVRSAREGIFFVKEGETVPDSINAMGTLIHYNDSSEIRIMLCDLRPSERYISSFYADGVRDWIKICTYSDASKKAAKATYVPSKENPLRVEITSVVWVTKREPIIEVKLDGVLYNRENNEDTIVIKGAYGTR